MNFSGFFLIVVTNDLFLNRYTFLHILYSQTSQCSEENRFILLSLWTFLPEVAISL